MKKFALKGLGILAAVVLLCVFFSGTLHTLMTAKVSFAAARTGRLERTIHLTGSLHWPEAEGLSVQEISGTENLIVERLYVAAGSYAEKGEPLLSYRPADAASRRETLQTEYDTKESEYLELLRKNSGIHLTAQQEEWIQSYQALKAARSATAQARVEFRSACLAQGVSPNGDALPEGAGDESLQAKAETLAQLLTAEEEALSAFERCNRMGIDESIISYMESKTRLEEEMDELSDQLAQLDASVENGMTLTASHDGFITEVNCKEGDTITGSTVVLKIGIEGAMPAIRLDASSLNMEIADGSSLTLEAGGKTLSAQTSGQGVAADGLLYVDAALDSKGITTLGGVNALTESGSVSASITSKDEDSTTLIPTAALRGSDGDYYVYLAQSSVNALGAEKWIVTKKSVKLLGQGENVSSVSENLKNEKIIYLEDRSLSEGCEVMEYSD